MCVNVDSKWTKKIFGMEASRKTSDFAFAMHSEYKKYEFRKSAKNRPSPASLL